MGWRFRKVMFFHSRSFSCFPYCIVMLLLGLPVECLEKLRQVQSYTAHVSDMRRSQSVESNSREYNPVFHVADIGKHRSSGDSATRTIVPGSLPYTHKCYLVNQRQSVR